MYTISSRCMTILLFLFASTGMVAAQGPAGTAGPIEAARPGFAEPASVVPAGAAHLEAGYTFSKTAGHSQHTFGSTLIRYGITAKIEAGLGINSYISAADGGNADGFDDGLVNIRYRLSEGSGTFDPLRPAAAILCYASLPTGDPDLGTEKVQPGVSLAFGYSTGTFLSPYGTLGFDYSRGDDSFYTTWAVAGASADITGAVGWYTELYRAMPESGYGDAENHAQTGITWIAQQNVQLDVHGAVSLQDAADYFVGLGFAYRIFINQR